jgi:6-pyruvoyltetrahydropterin/6-carboxytetrahydropterin synthase
MIYLTRHEHFNAAHKLYNPQWTEEKNQQVFGKCANQNWHGHNYELIITIKGEINPATGFLMDARELSTIIQDRVCEKLDHRNLNMDVDFMQGILASTENLAVAIWNQLTPHLPAGVKLHCVKIYETPRICIEYFGG